MWRGHYTEDWERKKKYLIRTLFRDIPLLSPVPEEENSDNDSSLSASPSSYRTWVRTKDRRPYSPLPPLIVEREPNKHDEPDEFYEKLTVRMRRYYRQQIFEGRNSKNSSEEYLHQSGCSIESDYSGSLDSIFKQNMAAAKQYSDKIQSLVYESRCFDESQDRDTIKIISNNGLHTKGDIHTELSASYEEIMELAVSQFNSEINKESSGQSQSDNSGSDTNNKINRSGTISSASSVTSDPGGYYQQVTFEAQVHRDASVQDDLRLSLVYEQPIPEEDFGQYCDQEVARLEKARVSGLVTDVRRTTSNLLNRNEIETMRSSQAVCIRTSYGSLLEHPPDESDERISPEATKHTLEDPLDTTPVSDDIHQMLQTSTPLATPKTAEKRQLDAQSVSDYTSSSHKKRRRYKDISIQVNQIKEWSSLRANFFVGTPKIFRLCCCHDHICA